MSSRLLYWSWLTEGRAYLHVSHNSKCIDISIKDLISSEARHCYGPQKDTDKLTY